MPRKKVALVSATHRASEARRIVTDRHELIARLKASGHSTLDAERALRTYVSALKHLRITSAELEMKAKPKNAKKSLNRTEALSANYCPSKQRTLVGGARCAAGPHGRSPLICAVTGPLACAVVAGHAAPGDG